MAGRPKRRARLLAEGRWAGSSRSSARASSSRASYRPSSDRRCPSSHALHTVAGRTLCLSRDVARWLRTGNGSGSELTRGGTPAQARQDLDRAVRAHLSAERRHPDHNARFGIETKYETRSKLVHDGWGGQGMWLELHTSVGHGIYPRGVISVSVDFG